MPHSQLDVLEYLQITYHRADFTMEKFKSELLILAAVLAMFTTISGDNGDHLLPEGYRKEVLMGQSTSYILI